MTVWSNFSSLFTSYWSESTCCKCHSIHQHQQPRLQYSSVSPRPISGLPWKQKIEAKVLQMLDLCECVYLLIKEENRQVFLADSILFFCLLSVYLHLSSIHLYNLMLLASGWDHNALPRCSDSMHNQPHSLRSPPRSAAPRRSHTHSIGKESLLQPLLFFSQKWNEQKVRCTSLEIAAACTCKYEWFCVCVLLDWQWCGSVLLDLYSCCQRPPTQEKKTAFHGAASLLWPDEDNRGVLLPDLLVIGKDKSNA